LIEIAETRALNILSNEVLALKDNAVQLINEQIETLTTAAHISRQATILRMEDTNRESIAKLRQEIDLMILTAKEKRLNQIVRLEDELTTAVALGIEEPVTWDDLRPAHNDSQITNEFGGSDAGAPGYFKGARILKVELNRLKNREDEKPFIDGLIERESKIFELKNDSKMAALKARKDDSIYIEKFDDLHRQLSDVESMPSQFPNSHLAIISKLASISAKPTRSWIVVFVTGLFLSLLLALMVASIRIMMRET
jgi:hypothetical protein